MLIGLAVRKIAGQQRTSTLLRPIKKLALVSIPLPQF
jgi:hypothetical protein